jgi:hypothetical protein
MNTGAGDMNDTLRDEAVRARFSQREKYHRPDGDDVDRDAFSHIGRSKDHDYPCRPTGEEWPKGVFGRIYVKVITPDGTEHVIPKDELVEKQQSARPTRCRSRCRGRNRSPTTGKTQSHAITSALAGVA